MTARDLLASKTHYAMCCNGCFEQGESGGRIYAGKFHKTLGMWVGVGCEECNNRGYTVESNEDLEAYIRHLKRCEAEIFTQMNAV